jgi:hypothetical protein
MRETKKNSGFSAWLLFLLFVVGLARAAAAPPHHPTIASVTSALARDGYKVVRTVGTDAGPLDAFGVAAESKTAKSTATGKPKTAFFLRGTGLEMGRVMSELAPDAVRSMLTTYLDLLPLELIDPTMPNDVVSRAIGFAVREVLQRVATDAFRVHAKTDFPQLLIDEMQGLAEGLAKTLGTAGAVTTAVNTGRFGTTTDDDGDDNDNNDETPTRRRGARSRGCER